MSIQTELTRITTDRNTIRTKLTALGLATSTDNLDTLAAAIDGIANKGTPDATVQEGETYTIQAGYYQGGTVRGVSGGGHYELQSKTGIVPTKSQQTITPDEGYYGLSSVQVNAIPENYQDVSSVTATAGDVLANKTIVSSNGVVVAGTMPNIGTVTQVLDAGHTSQTIAKGYHSGNGAISIVPETKEVTPTKADQEVTPSTGKVITEITVKAIPAQYGDASAADAVAANLLTGKKAITYDATEGTAIEIEGTMANNGAVTPAQLAAGASYTIPAGYHNGSGVITAKTLASQTGVDSGKTAIDANSVLSGYQGWVNGAKVSGNITSRSKITATIDGLTTTSYSIAAGYYAEAGTVSLTDDIETALAAI